MERCLFSHGSRAYSDLHRDQVHRIVICIPGSSVLSLCQLVLDDTLANRERGREEELDAFIIKIPAVAQLSLVTSKLATRRQNRPPFIVHTVRRRGERKETRGEKRKVSVFYLIATHWTHTRTHSGQSDLGRGEWQWEPQTLLSQPDLTTGHSPLPVSPIECPFLSLEFAFCLLPVPVQQMQVTGWLRHPFPVTERFIIHSLTHVRVSSGCCVKHSLSLSTTQTFNFHLEANAVILFPSSF